ncbi:MAG TPA: YceI family protein [Gemmatimonadaceae bacterium]|nr:YceI family protein [Gemmatimonadaceae bacterium]
MAGGTAVQARVSTWQLDPAHSSVEFSVKHMMMTTVRGRFKEVSATLHCDEEDPLRCRVEAEIRTASLDTGAPERDAHLRSADFFDAERYPMIRFRSMRAEGHVHPEEGSRFRVIGDLTIRDTTMEVAFDCVLEGQGRDPWGKERMGFSAQTEIDRRDWGLRWNHAIETGGVLVANKVRIEVEVQFVRQEA